MENGGSFFIMEVQTRFWRDFLTGGIFGMIVPKYFEDLHVLHKNTMPNRAYYIPASVPMDLQPENREASDRFLLLSGDWKFRYFENIYDVKEEFFRDGYDASAFDEVKVPGVWQNYGYDRHQYTNTRYPFPMDPPYVPVVNPCGAYVRYFSYEKDPKAPKAYLNFEMCIRDSSTITAIKRIRKKHRIPVISTEENSAGIWKKISIKKEQWKNGSLTV